MTLRELVETMVTERGWKLSGGQHQPILSIPQANGRHQAVILSEFSDGDESMIRMTTRIGPVSAIQGSRLRFALELNHRLPHGCLAVDGEHLVMTMTRPLGTTTSKSSGDAIQFIARQADSYESSIFGTDVH